MVKIYINISEFNKDEPENGEVYIMNCAFLDDSNPFHYNVEICNDRCYGLFAKLEDAVEYAEFLINKGV